MIQETESHQSSEALLYLCKMLCFLNVQFLHSRLDVQTSQRKLVKPNPYLVVTLWKNILPL